MASRRRRQRRGAGAHAQLAGAARGRSRWRRLCGEAAGEQSVCAEAAAFQASCEGGDLALHERWSERGGPLRLQGRPRQVRGAADRRQDPRRRRRPAGLSRSADAEPVRVQALRTEWKAGVGGLSEPRTARRRHRVHSLGVRPLERSRAGALRDAVGANPGGIPERRFVDFVWSWHRKHQPAGVRRDCRPQGRTDWRSDQLERRLHAGRVSGNALPRERRSDRRSEAGCGNDTGDPALAAGSAVEAQRARHGEVPGRHGSVGSDLVVRARVPHAGLRTEGDRHRQRVGSRPRSCMVSTMR